jgi:hypothetical protein
VAAAAEELHELLLAWEELTWREEVLATGEKKAMILEKAIAKVTTDLNTDQAKAVATWKEYLDKMEAHTTWAKHSLSLDKMLGEKKVELDGREWDLNLREAVLAEEQFWGLNPWDNHEELMELVELRRFL